MGPAPPRWRPCRARGASEQQPGDRQRLGDLLVVRGSGSPGPASSPARRSAGRCGRATRCRWRGSTCPRSRRRFPSAALRRSERAALRSESRSRFGRSGSAPPLRCPRRWCRPGCRTRRRSRAAVRGSIRPRLFSPSVSSSTTLDLLGCAPQPVHRRGEPGADGGAVLQASDAEVHHRLLQHRIVERDRHLGQRLAGERHQADPVGAPAPDEVDRLLLRHLQPVATARSPPRSMLLEMSIAITIAMPSFFISIRLPPTRGPAAPTMKQASASVRRIGGSRSHHGAPPMAAGRETSLYEQAGRRSPAPPPPPDQREQQEEQEGTREAHAVSVRSSRAARASASAAIARADAASPGPKQRVGPARRAASPPRARGATHADGARGRAATAASAPRAAHRRPSSASSGEHPAAQRRAGPPCRRRSCGRPAPPPPVVDRDQQERGAQQQDAAPARASGSAGGSGRASGCGAGSGIAGQVGQDAGDRDRQRGRRKRIVVAVRRDAGAGPALPPRASPGSHPTAG